MARNKQEVASNTDQRSKNYVKSQGGNQAESEHREGKMPEHAEQDCDSRISKTMRRQACKMACNQYQPNVINIDVTAEVDLLDELTTAPFGR